MTTEELNRILDDFYNEDWEDFRDENYVGVAERLTEEQKREIASHAKRIPYLDIYDIEKADGITFLFGYFEAYGDVMVYRNNRTGEFVEIYISIGD